jgi:hypothetical protein
MASKSLVGIPDEPVETLILQRLMSRMIEAVIESVAGISGRARRPESTNQKREDGTYAKKDRSVRLGHNGETNIV